MIPAFTPDAGGSLLLGFTRCSENLERKRLQKYKFFLQSIPRTKYGCSV